MGGGGVYGRGLLHQAVVTVSQFRFPVFSTAAASLLFMKVTVFFLIPRMHVCVQVTGDYGTPPLFSVYRTQLLAYMLILVICKAVTTVIVITMDEVLSSLAKELFKPVSDYPELELTIVMIICPW